MAIQYQTTDKGTLWRDVTVSTVADVTPAITVVVNQNKLLTKKDILDALEQMKVRVLRDNYPV